MPSIRTQENIGKLIKTSSTTVQLPAGSRVNVGALQLINTSALQVSTGSIGVGGLDAALTASSVYYMYAINNAGNLALIGSKNSSLPSGYTQARMIGVFYVGSNSNLYSVTNRNLPVTSFTKITKETALTVTGDNGFVNYATPSTGIAYTDSNGNCRLTFNIGGNMTGSPTSGTVTISGVKFKSGMYSSVTVMNPSATSWALGQMGSNNGNITWWSGNVINDLRMSGGVALNEEPTWAVTNMEDIIWNT